MDRDLRKASIDAINEVNQQEYAVYQDLKSVAHLTYEMAFKMQIAGPE